MIFQESLLPQKGSTRRPVWVLTSFLVQCVVVSLLLLLPLMSRDALPRTTFGSVLVAPSPPMAPPPPTPPQSVEVVRRKMPRIPSRDVFRAPQHVPTQIVMINDIGRLPDDPVINPTGPLGNIAQPDLGKIAAPLAPPQPKPVPVNDKPIRVGGNVEQPRLIHQEKPDYPSTAKFARVEGTVRLEATIAKDGAIKNLHLLGGPPLLVQAAMQAVQKWRYTATLLNGEPVEVLTNIDVNFTLTR